MAGISKQARNLLDVAINDLVNEALALSFKAHHWHLAVTGPGSYAKHMALGDIYPYFHDVADKLSETAQGAGMTVATTGSVAVKLTPPDRAVAEIEGFIVKLEVAEDSMDEVEGLEWMVNIIQEIQGTLYGHLYKLKRLA